LPRNRPRSKASANAPTSQPLERLARDAPTLNQHGIIACPALATYGAMMLGQEHPSPLY
jgi:hypothetical protein